MTEIEIKYRIIEKLNACAEKIRDDDIHGGLTLIKEAIRIHDEEFGSSNPSAPANVGAVNEASGS